ncbi:MAG: hypothetical protein P8M53_01530, partial [Pirellulales bacterium]|nr:hypothetical protein [Pirellulales bacterium]
AVPNMLGDGGLLQPNLFVSTSQLFEMQQHATKICENNSVIPRDRLGFHFDSLQTVRNGDFGGDPLYRNLQEYRFWGEKTFLDETLSVDLIIPLLYTSQYDIAGVQEFGAHPLDGEFGDLAFGLKALIWEDADKAFSAGVRAEAPTAADISVAAVPPTVNSFFEMDAWYFTPWIGGQWTPGSNWFASGFLSYRLNSGPITNTGLPAVGTFDIRQPTYLFADLAIGRWIVQREGQGGLTSLAPVLELHYTTTPTSGTVIEPGRQNIYDTGRRFGKTDYLNLTGALTGTINDAWQFGIGGALPLRTGLTDGQGDFATDRNYSWALLANLNYYFR